MEENLLKKLNKVIALGKEVQIHLNKIDSDEMLKFQEDLEYVKRQVGKKIYSRGIDFIVH